VFDLVGIEIGLLGVTEEIPDPVTEGPDVLEQFGRDAAGAGSDRLRLGPHGPRPQARALGGGPLDEILQRVDRFAGAALRDQGDKPLTAPPDLPDQGGKKPLLVRGQCVGLLQLVRLAPAPMKCRARTARLWFDGSGSASSGP